MANGTGWRERYLDENGRMHDDVGSQDKEDEYFRQFSDEIKKVVTHFAKDNRRPMRGNHAKILAGIVGAQFRVSPDIPSDLSVGFLGEKPENNDFYETTIRFSNASSRFRDDDTLPDLRGIAIRIKTRQGDHDFLMTNANEHHAKDAREAMAAIMSGIDKDIAEHFFGDGAIGREIGGLPAVVELTLHLGLPTAWHIAQTLKKQMTEKVTSLATETYWSRAPIAVGKVPDPQQSVAVKYRLQPVIDGSDLPGNKPGVGADKPGLGAELKNRIKERAVKFLFQVQRYADDDTTPIEDATIIWRDNFETIAELTIPPEAVIDDDFVNGLVFSPWNLNLDTFRPLGSMNRARRVVYPASASLR